MTPYITKGSSGEHFCNVEDRLSLVAKSIWIFGYGWKDGYEYGPQKRPKERQSFGAKKEGSDRRKLFHREERPTLERNIIDTSERARANYRYVIGEHFGF